MENYDDDDDVNVTDEKTLSPAMEQFLLDRFGKPETKQAATGIDSYLNDRFGSPAGTVKEKSVAEMFQEIKNRR